MNAQESPLDVTLRGSDADWNPVSPKLASVRLITLGICLAIRLIVFGVLAIVFGAWWWIGVGVVALLGAWTAWVIVRQVSAISWLELEEEIVIRRGRLFRSLVSVPYGRLQYVDIESGPLMRLYGLATCEIHTGSPESEGRISGLPTADAEALRTRLAARGESQRAGL